MPDTTQQSKSLLALSALVSPRVRIEGIRLSRSETRSAPPAPGTPLRIEYALNGEAKADRESKRIAACASFMVRANAADGSAPPEAAFQMDAEFLLDYAITSFDGISDEHVQAFGKMNGIYNAWPYWREYVQSMTARMGFPSLTLPVLTGEAILKIYQQQEAAATKGDDGLREQPVEPATTPQ